MFGHLAAGFGGVDVLRMVSEVVEEAGGSKRTWTPAFPTQEAVVVLAEVAHLIVTVVGAGEVALVLILEVAPLQTLLGEWRSIVAGSISIDHGVSMIVNSNAKPCSSTPQSPRLKNCCELCMRSQLKENY